MWEELLRDNNIIIKTLLETNNMNLGRRPSPLCVCVKLGKLYVVKHNCVT